MDIKALTFDVFGTVVDWRSSIAREGEVFAKLHNIKGIDWVKFAESWRAGYTPSMNRVRNGEIPWANIDELHKSILNKLILKYGIEGISDEDKNDFNRAWHRLSPWPDVIGGLKRLRSKFVIATLSNGNVSLLTNMAKNAGLPWDCILSAELSQHYKPDPEVYTTAVGLLGLHPYQVMMVAAHNFDLEAAKQIGMKTAYVHRPLEYGPDKDLEQISIEDFDFVAKDFENLAEILEC
tara:strand:- start:1528 stop:2235 length:708 start_codon:yes stop_codon:yes gene_type:complete